MQRACDRGVFSSASMQSPHTGGSSSIRAHRDFLVPPPSREPVPQLRDLMPCPCTSKWVVERALGQETKIWVQIMVLFTGSVTTGLSVRPSFDFFFFLAVTRG